MATVTLLIGALSTPPSQAQQPSFATFEERVVIGSCGSDFLNGQNDSAGENLALDHQAEGVLNEEPWDCQAIAAAGASGGTRPHADIQLSTNALGHAARADGRIDINYVVRLNGPAGVPVQVMVSAAGSVSGSADESSFPGFTRADGLAFLDGPGPLNSLVACAWWVFDECGGTGEGGDNFSVSEVMMMVPGDYFIFMSAQAHAQVGTAKAEDNTAGVQVVVDPSFEFVNPADAAIYSFEFSPNMIEGLIFADGFESGFPHAFNEVVP